MILALGCLQSRSCNTDHCPTGIATQARAAGLVVSDKGVHVATFHQAQVENLVELLAAAGLDNLEQLEPKPINHRVNGTNIKTYEQLYPCIEAGCFLNEASLPEDWKNDWQSARSDRW